MHHVLPVSLFPEYKLVVGNGITLCKFHHTELHRAKLELVLAPRIHKRWIVGNIEPHLALTRTSEFKALIELKWKALPAHELLRVVEKNPKRVIVELHPKWAAEVLGL